MSTPTPSLTLRDLPSVDRLLADEELQHLADQLGVQAVRDEIRTLQNEMRNNRSVPDWATSAAAYAQRISTQLRTTAYQPVFNLTGTVIHTNLGRALLDKDTWRHVETLVTRPMNLEYDISAGQRGDRDAVIEQRLQRLTGCEAATVVNNNAAALFLVLNTFALGKQVPVSRGELIEIGGSFRLPELMARSGCTLLEVGTTNRTHKRDYEAVLDDAAMLLKVHPSNYHINGFTKEVNAAELATMARSHNIPSCVDLGAGTLVDLTRWGLPPEPTPQSVLADGIDVVTFSGDKLLGGVQAGIIVGDKQSLQAIKTNPLKRALRADKITLAILESTLKLYERPDTLPDNLALLRTLTLSEAALRKRAEQLQACFAAEWTVEITASQGQIGSGALPDKTISSVALTLRHARHSANDIEAALRALPTPVIGRIRDDQVWLDVRGADPLDELISNLGHLNL
ncbi:MAG: L-seryl-tRNA(Sec) selenium transferase [Pseudomonadota bacterium]